VRITRRPIYPKPMGNLFSAYSHETINKKDISAKSLPTDFLSVGFCTCCTLQPLGTLYEPLCNIPLFSEESEQAGTSCGKKRRQIIGYRSKVEGIRCEVRLGQPGYLYNVVRY